MKTGLEPPLRAEEDVSRALASIIATTRRHWSLPSDRPESFGSRPYSRRATIAKEAAALGVMYGRACGMLRGAPQTTAPPTPRRRD